MQRFFSVLFCTGTLFGKAQSRLDVQGHRRGRGLMPENSIPAMLNAVKLGVRTLELDCVISSDGKVVVSHDVEANIADLGFDPTIYSPNYRLVDADLVKKAHKRKIAVLPWTVNEEKDMQSLAALGVDGMISDYPDRLVRLFGCYQQ